MYPSSEGEYQEMMNANAEADAQAYGNAAEAEAEVELSKIMNFDNYKFHASSIGKIMTESKTKDSLGETCKGHLLECWIGAKYGRYRELENEYVEKGNLVEQDSMTLYSRVTKTFYKKNEQVFENDFIIGTPDIIHENTIIDLKSSWSIHTFFQVIHKPLNKDYVYQINGYKDIVQVELGKLVYVLVNTPDVLIENQKSKLRYKMGLIDPEANPVYVKACEEIDKNSIFDDIDIKERYIEFEVPAVDIVKVYDRIKECRNFLNSLG